MSAAVEASEGERPEGERPEGERPDGARPDGARPDGERPDGDFASGLFATHLPTAVSDLFKGYALDVRSTVAPPAETTPESEVAVSIAFTGNALNGSLGLKASEASIAHWLQALAMTGTDPTDALGEFSNMMLGGLKGRLLQEGLEIVMATPTVVQALGRRVSLPAGHSLSLTFVGEGWRASVQLDFTFDDHFELRQAPQVEAAPAGECILF